jgi:hypothetical protein
MIASKTYEIAMGLFCTSLSDSKLTQSRHTEKLFESLIYVIISRAHIM